jgi:hypothetical protein
MLRTPESRMDILSPAEIDSINGSSDLVQKYSQVIDRESAYEILSKKVEVVEKATADEASQKELEKGRRGEGGMQTSYPSQRTSYGRSVKTPQDEIVKVLTSATFIRGVFGILKKVMK